MAISLLEASYYGAIVHLEPKLCQPFVPTIVSSINKMVEEAPELMRKEISTLYFV
jgi:hypothetical protein